MAEPIRNSVFTLIPPKQRAKPPEPLKIEAVKFFTTKRPKKPKFSIYKGIYERLLTDSYATMPQHAGKSLQSWARKNGRLSVRFSAIEGGQCEVWVVRVT